MKGLCLTLMIHYGMTIGMTVIYDEVNVVVFQGFIDNGSAWLMEGSIGRTAMELIEEGACVLGREGHKDYWGNYVPSRYEVKPGTKGSEEYAKERGYIVFT